jgi:hypothetical protein
VTEPTRRAIVRDDLEVGAFFGAVAGVLAVVIVLVWWLVTRLFGTAVAFRPLVAAQLVNVFVYALLGAVMGGLWPRRGLEPVRFLLWLLASAAATMSLASVVEGPFWRWPLGLWGKFVLMAVVFTLVLGFTPRRSRRA